MKELAMRFNGNFGDISAVQGHVPTCPAMQGSTGAGSLRTGRKERTNERSQPELEPAARNTCMRHPWLLGTERQAED